MSSSVTCKCPALEETRKIQQNGNKKEVVLLMVPEEIEGRRRYLPAAAPWKALQFVLPRCSTSCVDSPRSEALLTSLTASSKAALAARPMVELKASSPPMPTHVPGDCAGVGAMAASTPPPQKLATTSSRIDISHALRHGSHMLSPLAFEESSLTRSAHTTAAPPPSPSSSTSSPQPSACMPSLQRSGARFQEWHEWLLIPPRMTCQKLGALHELHWL